MFGNTEVYILLEVNTTINVFIGQTQIEENICNMNKLYANGLEEVVNK